MRTAIIGQAPGREFENLPALQGKTLRRLMGLAGSKTEFEFRDYFEALNVLPHWPGKSGKGDAFPIEEAKKAAVRLEKYLVDRRVIFLGDLVAIVFGWSRTPKLQWRQCAAYEFAVLPHPSGINRWYNNPRNVSQASRFLQLAKFASRATVLHGNEQAAVI